MLVADIHDSLDELFPFENAAAWDPVGLQLGALDNDAGEIAVCHEVSEDIVAWSLTNGVNTLVSYHPLLFDPITALLRAASMAGTAVGLVRTALEDIMDQSLPAAELIAIEEVLQAHKDKVLGYHRLRTRRAGTTRHIDMHLIFESDRTVVDVHNAPDRIEADIRARLPDAEVVIHAEPDAGQEPPSVT